MSHFTVVSKKHVYRVQAKSSQALTRALRASRISWQAIYEDKEES